jgi:NTE family protein
LYTIGIIKYDVNAVFEGGGVRGIGIVGALTYLEGIGFKWNKVAGSSVGALIASLLASGYTSNELKNILIETDFQKFMDSDRIQSIPLLGKPLSFLTQNSIYSGDYVEKWIYDLLLKKGVKSFKDLECNGEIPLKMIASDITRRCTIVLPDDLIKYNIDPLTFSVAAAVRMSISIPFYFKPVRLKYKSGTCYIVDGCVTCSYPINIFDDEASHLIPTIGFKFEGSKESFTSMGKTDPLSFLFDIARAMSNRNDLEYFSDKNKSRSIIIPTAGVETTDFNISREKSHLLFKYGYRSAMDFMKRWSYTDL